MHYVIIGAAVLAYYTIDFGNVYANRSIMVIGIILFAVFTAIERLAAIIDAQNAEIEHLKDRIERLKDRIDHAPRYQIYPPNNA